ncbi:MAG: carbon-nitrogen hydrolase family protein [Methanobacteriota archaeon]|nr:MAG: carbon-nitrogen hydrolase family protein [Euryarchaeota archaeon]
MEKTDVAIIQMAPIFLNKEETISKLITFIDKTEGASIVTWGESLIPGYPQWLAMTGGAKFNDPDQKRAYSTYWKNSIDLNSDDLNPLLEAAKRNSAYLVGGITERSGGSLYCTLITIGPDGTLLGRHRKVKPTYEERLVWADGDSIGLRTYDTPFGKIGALNCWENWLPMARASLHAQGEFVHVSVWPGSLSLTENISKFTAIEGRMYVIASSAILRGSDFEHLDKDAFPMKEEMLQHDVIKDGGSMIVDPKGNIVAGPLLNEEGIIRGTLNLDTILEERQNFDYSGNYSRWDIFSYPLRKA